MLEKTTAYTLPQEALATDSVGCVGKQMRGSYLVTSYFLLGWFLGTWLLLSCARCVAGEMVEVGSVLLASRLFCQLYTKECSVGLDSEHSLCSSYCVSLDYVFLLHSCH